MTVNVFIIQDSFLPSGGDPNDCQVPELVSTHSRSPVSGRVGRVSREDLGQPDEEGSDVLGEKASPHSRSPAGNATIPRL